MSSRSKRARRICRSSSTAIDADLNRLRDNLAFEHEQLAEWINRWPILDALYNGNIKLEQIWLPDMKINYNFRTVPRYDRCTNCHRSIDETAAGSATEPAYPDIPRGKRVRIVALGTPETAPPSGSDQPPATLTSVYGMALAPRGQIDSTAVTIQVVLPESRAAEAGLVMGDVIEKIGGGQIHTAADVDNALLVDANWGKPIDADDSSRFGAAVHVAPAARLVCRQHEPAQAGRDGLHDLPRRAGECDRLQVGLAHAEQSASGPRLVAEIWLVRQPSLDFPDDAGAVHREQLPEVSS